MTLAVIQADKARHRFMRFRFRVGRTDIRKISPVRRDDIRKSVTIEIRDRHISRLPTGLAKRSDLGEVPLAIVPVHQLAVRRIIAHHNVEMAIAIHIGQRRGVGPRRRCAQIAGRKASLAIVQQHPAVQRPVPALAQHDIQQPVAI